MNTISHADRYDLEDLEYVTIRVTSDIPAVQMSEPNEAVLGLHGDIMIDNGGSDERRNQKIGYVRAFIVDPAVCNENDFSILDTMDAHSQDLAEFLVVMDRQGSVKERISNQFGSFFHRLLVLDRMRIEPPYRGHNLGLFAIYRMIQMYGHGALSLLKAYPFEIKKDDVGADEIQRRIRKLESYYARLGFRRIRGTSLMGWPWDRAMKRPKLV